MNHAQGARRIGVLNNKGGVGKTLICALLTEVLAGRGYRVLAVDMDPQGNLSRRLRAPRQVGRTLAEILTTSVRNGAAADIIVRCGWDLGGAEQLIGVLPASIELEDRVLEAGMPGAVNRLRKALFGADDGYDFTIIDCPPSMGHLTQNGLAALDGSGDGRTLPDTVLIPVAPDWDAISGARRVVQFVDAYRADLGVEHLVAGGLVVNLVRPNTSLHAVRVDELAGLFPDVPVLSPHISLRARIAERQDSGEPLSTDVLVPGLVADINALAARALSLPAVVAPAVAPTGVPA